MPRRFRSWLAGLALLVAAAVSRAEGAKEEWFDQGPVFSGMAENDLVFNTDRHYTHGSKVIYWQRDGSVPRWLDALSEKIPTLAYAQRTAKFGYEIGQNIYTPADITTTLLQPGDRPYAGWMYLGLAWQRRGLDRRERPALETFTLELGVVGPGALSDRAQTWVHEVRGFNLPLGWDHQLKNEPGLVLKYFRASVFSPWAGDFRWLDLVPHAGLAVGNVDTSFRAGGLVRVGWNLPDDFGPRSINSLSADAGGWSSSRKKLRWGFYAFSDWEGRVVARNEFLDGSLFHRSHSVASEPLVAEWKNGVVVVLNRFELGYTHAYSTTEFKGQRERDRYGSVFIRCKF